MSEKMHVLLVEDNPADVELLQELVPQDDVATFQFEPVSRLSEAIDRVKKGGLDLVLLDLGLPDSNGLETFVRLHEASAEIPIIVLSGNVNQELAIEAVRRGAQDYLVKGQFVGNLLSRAARYAVERKRSEAALREAELYSRTLLNIGSALIWTSDLDKKCDYFNQPWLDFTGRTLEQELGDGWAEGVHPDDLARCFETYTEAFDRRECFSMAYRLRRHDGVYRWIQDDGAPRYDTHSEFRGYVGHCLDITDLKRSEEARWASETQFHRLFATMAEGVALHELLLDESGKPENYRIVEVNPAFEKHTGIKAEDVVGKLATQAYQHDEPPFIEQYSPVALSGIPDSFESYAPSVDRHFAISVTPWGDKGFATIFSDITEEKRTQETLQKSEEELRTVLDATPFPVAIVDAADNNIQFWSRSALTLFGHTGPTTPEWYQLAYPDPDYRQDVIERWKPNLEKARLSGETVNTGEYRVTCHDGSIRICELYATFLAEKLVVTFNDITARKQAEEAVRESQEQFHIAQDLSPDGFTILRPVSDAQERVVDFTWVYENAAIARLNGTDPEAVVGRRLLELFPGHRGTPILRAYQQVAESGETCIFEADYSGESMPNPTSFRLAVVPMGGNIAILAQDITARKRAEETLRESEERFRGIFEFSTIGKSLTAPDGKLLKVNRSFAEMLGRTVEEMQTLDFAAITHPDDVANSREMIRALMAREQATYRLEKRYIHKQGHIVWADVSTTLLRSADDTPLYLITSIVDISARKKAEDALRESEELFRGIFERTAIGKSLTAPDGKLLAINTALAEMVGRTVEEMQTVTLASITHPDDIGKSGNIERGLMERERTTYRREKRYLHKDGHIVWVDVSTSLMWDSEKKPLYFVNSVVDITARKQAEDALRESEEHLKATLRSIGDGVIGTDRLGNVTVLNTVAEKLTGWSADEALGRPVLEVFNIVQATTREPAENPIARVLAEGVVVGLANHTMLISRDGTEYQIADSAAPIRLEDGELIGIVLVFRDVTEQYRLREALVANERKYRTLFDNIATGSCLDEVIYEDGKAVDYRILDINPAFERIIGVKKADVVGFLASEIYGTKDIPFFDIYAKVTETGEPVSFEGYFAPAGKFLRVTASCPESGKFTTAFSDITDETVAAEALAASETRYRRLFESAKDGILILDAETGMVMDVNPFLMELLGYSHEQFTGRAIWELGLLGDTVANIENFRALQRDKYARYEDMALKAADGREIAVEFVSNVYLVSGRLVVQCNIRDITDRKHAQDALRESEEKFRSYVDQAPDGIFVVDEAGNYVDVNVAACAITGYSRDEILGMRLHEMVPEEDKEKAAEHFRRVVESGNGMAELRFVRKGGEVRYWTVNAVKLTDSRFLGFVTDITEHKALENQLVQAQKLESVGRLAGGVAHDFNNSLQAMLGYADLGLMCVEPDSRMQGYLTEIKKGAERSAGLTKQLLAFSRKEVISPKIVQLNDVIFDVQKMLTRLIPEDIRLVWGISAGLWPIYVDPTQIDQVLVNVIVNARDAIKGTGTIRIETKNRSIDDGYAMVHPDSVPGDYVLLSVSDTGCGMDTETVAHIFEPFFTTKGVGEGTGLGLATVYGVMRQNQGFINVYSEPGHGSTFSLYFPRCEETGADGEVDREEEGAVVMGTETVLLVEDQEQVLRLAKLVLESQGYTVISASTPDEAISVAQQYPGVIHLLLTDVVMPGMNGKELKEKLDTVRPGMKCILMSGYTADVIANRGVLEAGMHFLQKPFSTRALSQKVREALAG